MQVCRMPDATAAAVFIGKRALADLRKKVRSWTPQGKFEAENQEQFESLSVDNAQSIQVLAARIDATDSDLAHMGNRVEEVARVVSDLIDYQTDLIAEWYKDDPEHQPAQEDKENLAAETTKAYYYAGSNEKRDIIWAAFSNSLNPTFYKEGLYKILWRLVEKLEYPHFRVLGEIQRLNVIFANVADEVFYAREMASLGLVREAVIAHDRTGFPPMPISFKLLAFATPPKAAVPAAPAGQAG